MMARRVFVGMSGGVDSSVAAMLLVRQGYDVTGVYMKNWSEDLPGMRCPWAEDLADAKRVAVRLGIDFEVWDFEKEYRQRVVEYMLAEFRAGRTPNPDVMCNQEIKFKLFLERALAAGADFIATGHYARRIEEVWGGGGEKGIEADTRKGEAQAEPLESEVQDGTPEERKSVRGGTSGEWKNACGGTSEDGQEGVRSETPDEWRNVQLGRAVDENKDQTYFLYRISEEAMRRTLFPLGELRKPEVKKLAAEAGLPNAYKKESMGVCFIGEVGMRDFLHGQIATRPGEIREAETGRVLGQHEGAELYTIGQRHGLYLAETAKITKTTNGRKGKPDDAGQEGTSVGTMANVGQKEINAGMPTKTGLPYYVVGKDLGENVVYVSQNLNHPGLWAEKLELRDIVWRDAADVKCPSEKRPSKSAVMELEKGGRDAETQVMFSPPREVLVRLRHRGELIPAKFDGARVDFGQKIRRPDSGQSAVFYDEKFCLGGGIIV